MWTFKLFPVLVLLSIVQARSHKPTRFYIYEDKDEGSAGMQLDGNVISIPGEDGHADSRRLFVLSRDSTPNSEKVNAGFEIFGIPIGPQISYSREKDKKQHAPIPREEVIRPVYIPIETRNNDDRYEANGKREIIRVPAEKLKQHFIVSQAAYGRSPELETFPIEHQDTKRTVLISGDPSRRNEKVTAGIKIFGVPIGQFSLNKDNDQNEKWHAEENANFEAVGHTASGNAGSEGRWIRRLVTE